MKSINLIFGCHCHQPIGNFDHIFSEAHAKAYLPFLKVLQRYPAVRVTLHYSGPLFDWFEQQAPAFIELLASMVRSGQIEIMGGAYYEALLCAIPERDAVDQIRRMNEFCERRFGKRPRGMWLTERVWEPHMPKILRKAGIEYTALDDTHFMMSGLAPEELFGYYVTEDEGHTLKIFPILEPLRYAIPFQQVYKTIDFLKEHATEDGLRCAVIHDDGEKFGIWPETYKSVYEEGWLEEFFSALTENRDWLHCLTYSEFLDKTPALGRTYITCASYVEMMEWALPPAMQRRMHHIKAKLNTDPESAREARLFVKGGFWRSFLAKYPESNHMHKRMLRVSSRIDSLTHLSGNADLETARQLLHQGQCNCAYWHGVFGGLYLNHLRTAVYEKLIASERVLDSLTHQGNEWVNCEQLDFDGDGFDEILLENKSVGMVFAPQDGGTMLELSFKETPFNFLNTLARRDEAYHDALKQDEPQLAAEVKGTQSIHDIVRTKETGLAGYLMQDRYRRSSLRDRFLSRDVIDDELWRGVENELGDFAQGLYVSRVTDDSVLLSRRGHVRNDAVYLEKKITLKPGASSAEIEYHISNAGSERLSDLFGVEFCVNLLSGMAFDRYYRSEQYDFNYAQLGTRGRTVGLSHIALRDDWGHLEFGLRFDTPATVFRFPIETVSQSEGGQERIYQSSVITPCWNIDMAPGDEMRVQLTVEVLNTAAPS